MYTMTLWACEKVAYKNDAHKIDPALYNWLFGLDILTTIALGWLLW